MDFVGQPRAARPADLLVQPPLGRLVQDDDQTVLVLVEDSGEPVHAQAADRTGLRIRGHAEHAHHSTGISVKPSMNPPSARGSSSAGAASLMSGKRRSSDSVATCSSIRASAAPTQ